VKKAALVFAVVSLAACVPIWSVTYFINQDGSGHINAAWLMLELIKGNPEVSRLFQFNFIFFPDVGGHWLLALLLTFIGPFAATKLMMSFTYVGLVAAVMWLRWCTNGRECFLVSVLIGGALAYNWLWLEGFYNFDLGFIIAVGAIGSFYRWREQMHLARAVYLAGLLVAVFVCHIVSFAIFAGAVAVLAAVPRSNISRRNLLWTAAAFIPVAPLALIYKFSTEASGSFVPIWRNLHDAFSISDWITQLRGIDSFILISRRSFPFVNGTSEAFAVFTPIAWILIALLALAFLTWLNRNSEAMPVKKYLPFGLLCVGSILVSLFSPDHFQFATSTGGVLRERIFLAGLIFFVPLYRSGGPRPLRILAFSALVLVIAFQSASLWEYSLRSDAAAREFVAVLPAIPEGKTLAAVTIIPDGMRFSSNPISSLDNYIGIERNVFVWDNYEFGHYLFPLVMRSKADQQFALEFTGGNTYELNNPDSYSEERFNRLSSALAAGNSRIDTLLVWGSDARVESIFAPYFEPTPFYATGRVRLYRHR
jgi:hypothetical protein